MLDKNSMFVQLQDNFVQDENLYKRLHEEKNVKDMLNYYCWWDGWWKVKPRNVWEELIYLIWKDKIPEDVEIAGIEYWYNGLNDKKDNHGLPWHRDCDEFVRKKEGKIISPLLGSIYYNNVTRNIQGGKLEIDPSGLAKYTGLPYNTVSLDPIPNRIVVMDVSNYHRVSPILRGARESFMSNLWEEKPRHFKMLKTDRVQADNIEY